MRPILKHYWSRFKSGNKFAFNRLYFIEKCYVFHKKSEFSISVMRCTNFYEQTTLIVLTKKQNSVLSEFAKKFPRKKYSTESIKILQILFFRYNFHDFWRIFIKVTHFNRYWNGASNEDISFFSMRV